MTTTRNTTLKSDSVAIEFRKRLAELKTNPRRLSAEIDCAYDTVRKVVKGVEFPGPKLLKRMCDYLGLDINLMQELVNLDKAIDKGWVELFTDEDPTITELKRYWVHLNANDKEEIIDLVKLKSSRLGSNGQTINS